MPSENEESGNFSENLKKDGKELYEKVKQYPLIFLILIIAVVFLTIVPYLEVYFQGVSDNKDRATLENQSRATWAQVLGGSCYWN